MINLFKLHDYIEDRGAYSWIVANGPEVFSNFKYLINKVTEKSNCSVKSLSREVSKRIGCSTSMLYDILNGRTKWISLVLINDLLSILKGFDIDEASKLKNEFFNSIRFLKATPRSPIEVKAVKMLSPELAEFCGIHAADGSLNLAIDIEAKKKKLLIEIKHNLQEGFPKLRISKIWKKRNKNKYGIYFYPAYQTRRKILEYLNKYNVGFNTSYKIELVDSEKNSVEYLRKLIADLFGYEIKIKTGEGNWYYVLFSNKIIGRYLKNIFGFPIGKKSDIVDAPELIKEAPFLIQKAFVRGLMQFDGSVKRKGTIAFSTNSRKLLDFFLGVLKEDRLQGTIWKRKARNQELGFESAPAKQWLTYFIRRTKKYKRLYEYLYGFKKEPKIIKEAIEILHKAFPPNNRSILTFPELIKKISKFEKFTNYQISDKLTVNYRTLLFMLRILENANVVKVDRVKMFERFKKKSDTITFNSNIKEWRIPQVSK